MREPTSINRGAPCRDRLRQTSGIAPCHTRRDRRYRLTGLLDAADGRRRGTIGRRGHPHARRSRGRPAPRRLPRSHHGRPPSGPSGRAGTGDRGGCGRGPPADRLAVPGAVAARRAAAARRAVRRPRRRRRAGLRRRRRRHGRRRRLPPQPRRAGRRRPRGAARRRGSGPDGARCSPSARASTTTRTSARCSATPPRSASTGCCSGPRCSDPLYRRSVRVSMGHVLRVPFATLPGPWPGSLDLLRDAGLRVVALTPAADAVPLARAGLDGRRVALLLGAEGPGLTREALAGRRPAGAHPDGDGRRLAQRGDGRRDRVPRRDRRRMSAGRVSAGRAPRAAPRPRTA